MCAAAIDTCALCWQPVLKLFMTDYIDLVFSDFKPLVNYNELIQVLCDVACTGLRSGGRNGRSSKCLTAAMSFVLQVHCMLHTIV